MCVLKGSDGAEECASGASDRHDDPRTEHSLEESCKLILQWADELKSVDKVRTNDESRLKSVKSFTHFDRVEQ